MLKKLYSNCTLALAVICLFISLFNGECRYPYWIFALNYGLFLKFCKNNIVYNTPGIIWMNVTMFAKYILLPLSYSVSGKLLGLDFVNNYNYMSEAFVIMIYEQIAIFIALSYSGKVQKQQLRLIDAKVPTIYEARIGLVIASLLSLILFVIVLKNRFFIGGFTLLTTGTVNSPEDVPDTGLIGVFYQAFTAWLFIYLCIRLKKWNLKFHKDLLWPTLTIALFYLLLTFIGQTRISRHYTVISAVSVLFILIKLYPHKQKKILTCLSIPFLLFLIITSAFKNAGYVAGQGSPILQFLSILNSETLEVYYLGPVTVNNALGLYHETDIGPSSFFLDLINNMPGVCGYFDRIGATVNQYNIYIGRWINGGGDQVIPLVGQSLIYFTPFLAPLLSVIFVFLVRYFDKKFYTSNTMMMYVYAFWAVWAGVVLSSNMTIHLSWVYIRIIPLFILIKFVESFGLLKKKIIKP